MPVLYQDDITAIQNDNPSFQTLYSECLIEWWLHSGTLKVKVYNGCQEAGGRIVTAAELASYDIVITTYEQLNIDIWRNPDSQAEARKLRHAKKHKVRSLLILCSSHLYTAKAFWNFQYHFKLSWSWNIGTPSTPGWPTCQDAKLTSHVTLLLYKYRTIKSTDEQIKDDRYLNYYLYDSCSEKTQQARAQALAPIHGMCCCKAWYDDLKCSLYEHIFCHERPSTTLSALKCLVQEVQVFDWCWWFDIVCMIF